METTTNPFRATLATAGSCALTTSCSGAGFPGVEFPGGVAFVATGTVSPALVAFTSWVQGSAMPSTGPVRPTVARRPLGDARGRDELLLASPLHLDAPRYGTSLRAHALAGPAAPEDRRSFPGDPT